MSTTTFKIIYNLDGLSDVDIEKYKVDVSAYFGLDPSMNWFDVLWMTDPDTSLRRRQLYARRGTTDILRDRRKISVQEMAQHDGPGYVSFTAKGQDPTGRTEIAVGAHSTEGLKGEKLAAAVSTAETRAGRRLTLKFCGLGILDYTEVTDPVDIKASPADLAPVALPPAFAAHLPMPTINNAPGKMVDPKERAAADSLAQATAEAAEIGRKALEEAAKQGVASLTSIPQPPASAYIAPETVVEVTRGDGLSIPVLPGASTVVDNTPLPAEAPAAPKTRKTRKKNTVDISAPGQVSASVETAPTQAVSAVPTQANPVAPVQVNPAVPTQVNSAAPSLASTAVTAVQHPAHLTMTLPTPPAPMPVFSPSGPSPVSVPAPPTTFPGQPSKEQEAQYREKLREYSNVILPGAGMVPSQGIGGPSAKLRVYAERMAGKSTQQMTTDDWDDFFSGMADFRNKNGDKGLVKYINDVIGAK